MSDQKLSEHFGIDPIEVDTEACLAVDRFEVDASSAHIKLVDQPELQEFAKLVRVCPAGLYRFDDQGEPSFDYAGCLECGTCRILCGETIIEQWRYPSAHAGIQYRYG